MQRLDIKLLQPEMISAVDVVDQDGKIIIRAGTAFQENHIKVVVQQGYGSVYVSLPRFTTHPPPGILNQELHKSLVSTVAETYEAFRDKNVMDGKKLRELANKLVDEVVINRTNLVQWVDLRTPDDYLPAHAVNVAVMSVLIGLKMEYTVLKLQELALGALLLDAGEMLIPQEILRKKEKLTPAEMEIVRQHTEKGFEGLRKKIKGLPVTSMHVAYQHHENFGGNGYPRGISGNEIHEYARIVSVADMFDALVSDRPFRHYYLPHEAVGILQIFSGRMLDPEKVATLLQYVALYPQGVMVHLDTGEFGEVEVVRAANPNRPRVRLLTDKWRKTLNQADYIDLERQQNRYITKVMKDQEIMDWITR